MKTDKASLNKARKLLDKLSIYEEALDVLSADNYDATINLYFVTGYNHNKKSDKAVKIPIDGLIKKDEVLDFIKMRISEIESEIEEL